MQRSNKTLERLASLDLFILDNSIRESTVGQLRGHTLENKKEIYRVARECGMKEIIVATLSEKHTVDDEFCKWLIEIGESPVGLWSFSEVFGDLHSNGLPDIDKIPAALEKNKKYGLYNTIFEVDLADSNRNWYGKCSATDIFNLIRNRMDFVVCTNFNARIMLNLRDFPKAMSECPERVLSLIENLAMMPTERRMFGIIFEDAFGESMPQEMAVWTKAIRDLMDECDWKNAHLLNHVHEKWELQTAATLECLAAGSNGIWASLCSEGAALGHASSTVTIMNLVRLGNKKVLHAYKCRNLRKAARKVTRITTGKCPDSKQSVYGSRALDTLSNDLGVGDFDLSEFFGESSENRMTPLASPEMIVDHLTRSFGFDPQFTVLRAENMLQRMRVDLSSVPPRKEEYQSPMGIAILFYRSGGKLTEKFSQAISKIAICNAHHLRLMSEIRKVWDFWDSQEDVKKNGKLCYDSFYHAFLSPYFGSASSDDTASAMRSIDMNEDGSISWDEFLVFIKWVLSQYPGTADFEELVKIAIQKAVIPGIKSHSFIKYDTTYSFKPFRGRYEKKVLQT